MIDWPLPLVHPMKKPYIMAKRSLSRKSKWMVKKVNSIRRCGSGNSAAAEKQQEAAGPSSTGQRRSKSGEWRR